MKLVWFDLNSSYAHSSLALPALHAQIKDDNVKWHKVQATINEDVASIVCQIVNLQPDIVTASCWLFTRDVLIQILARVKQLLPNCYILLGGPEFLGDNETFLRNNTFVNAVLRGEGEEVFPIWLKLWSNGKNEWRGLDGFCYLDAQKVYHDNGVAKVRSFETLVPPEQSCFFDWRKPFVQLETTRGCFSTCSFCVSGKEKPVRVLPIEVVEKRLATINSHGIRDVRILDRTFNYNMQHACKLLELFCKFPEMHFHLEIHPGLLPTQLKTRLADMPPGMLHLEAGIQSLRPSVLEQCKRVGNVTQSLDGLRYLCSLKNVVVHADLIAGLPLYHFNELLEDIHTLSSIGVGEIQLELLKLLPGTEMREYAIEWGICYSSLPPYEVLQTREMTVNELQEAYYLSRLLDGYYNTSAWQNVFRLLMLNSPDFLSKFLHYLVEMDVIKAPMSIEKRGMILYDYCKTHYPSYCLSISMAWIEAGMSLKKTPAGQIQTKHLIPPDNWEVLYGHYDSHLRLCFLSDNNGKGYWYGYNREEQQSRPVFKAKG